MYKVCIIQYFPFSYCILILLQVTDTRIVIAVDAPESGDADLDFPERCRIVKLANSVTYDR